MVKPSFSPFHGVQETVNGEIKIYKIGTSGLKIEVTDLDRLKKLESGGFQIAEHKSSEKLSLLDPIALNEVTRLFFLQDPVTGDLRLKSGVDSALVYYAIENRLSKKEQMKKARGKPTKLSRARRKYVESIINKARAISMAYQEIKQGSPRVEIKVNLEGKYTGPATEHEPNALKSIIASVRVIVFRFVDEESNQAIPISQHTKKSIQLLIALAQSKIDDLYGSLDIKIKFEQKTK